MVYLFRYGFAQPHYLKYRLRLTHRKRKKGNWMSFKPPALLLKMGYFWSIKSRCGRWKNYLITNFFGWELFSSDGSTVGTLGTCISQNVPILGIASMYVAGKKWKFLHQRCILSLLQLKAIVPLHCILLQWWIITLCQENI